MKKSHLSIVIITIITLLVLLFFTSPVQSKDRGIESLRHTSKALACVERKVSSSVVFIQVEVSPLYPSYQQFPMLFNDQWPLGSDLLMRFFREHFGGIKEPQSTHRQPKIVEQG
jgi:hypothetical protein